MPSWLVTGIVSGVARPSDGRVVALLADDEARQRVHRALGGQMTALTCRTASDIELTVHAHGADCVLVMPWDDSGRPSVPTVRRLRSRFPWLPIAVYCQCEPRTAHEIAALTRAGADTIIISGYDDLGRRLRERLAFAWSQRAATEALAALARWHTPESAPILGYCLHHAAEPLTVGAVAAALSLDRKTLGTRLAAAGLPAPRILIPWCRLLCAGRRLAGRGCRLTGWGCPLTGWGRRLAKVGCRLAGWGCQVGGVLRRVGTPHDRMAKWRSGAALPGRFAGRAGRFSTSCSWMCVWCRCGASRGSCDRRQIVRPV
jgi:hypothetical protein